MILPDPSHMSCHIKAEKIDKGAESLSFAKAMKDTKSLKTYASDGVKATEVKEAILVKSNTSVFEEPSPTVLTIFKKSEKETKTRQLSAISIEKHEGGNTDEGTIPIAACVDMQPMGMIELGKGRGHGKDLRLDFFEPKSSKKDEEEDMLIATDAVNGTDIAGDKGARYGSLIRGGGSFDAVGNFEEASSALACSKMRIGKENVLEVLENRSENGSDINKDASISIALTTNEESSLMKSFKVSVDSSINKGKSLIMPHYVFGFLVKVLTPLFVVVFQGNSLKKLLPSMMLLLFPLASVAASSTTTTTSISMHKSSLCGVDDAMPFKQMDATLGECKYQCISLRTCSGMQYVDPKQCLLYDVPFSSMKSVDDDAVTCGIKEKIFADEVAFNQFDDFLHHFRSKCGEAIDHDHATRVTDLDSFSACEDRCMAMKECKAFDWKGASKNVCNILEYVVVEEDILPVLGLDNKSDRVCGVRTQMDKSDAGDKESTGELVNQSDILDPIDETKESRSLEAVPASVESESDQNDFALDLSKSFQMSLESFMLLSSFKFDHSNREWCVREWFDTELEESRIKMWPCPDVNNLKHWFYIDSIGRFRLSVRPDQCLRWDDGTKLLFKDCGSSDSSKYTFVFSGGALRAMKDDNSLWLLGVKTVKPQDKYKYLRLFNRDNHGDNPSLYLWYTIYASESPSLVPTSQPTSQPSSSPSSKPSPSPSRRPSPQPSPSPSAKPTRLPSTEPSMLPSLLPSNAPSDEPSSTPSDQPSLQPSSIPSDQPSSLPSSTPSDVPSDIPSDQPSLLPSSTPSDQPSLLPSSEPSQEPSRDPSSEPSLLPSSEPSSEPSECVDEEGWVVGGNLDDYKNQPYAGTTCAELSNYTNPGSWCKAILNQPNSTYLGKAVDEACCACHGSTFKTNYPSVAPTDQPSFSSYPSVVPVASLSPSSCEDEPNWSFFDKDGHELGCSDIEESIERNGRDACTQFKDIYSDDKTVNSACCICGGGMHQSREPSSAPSVSTMPSFNSSAPSVCVDEEDWIVGGYSTYAGITCAELSAMNNTDSWCEAILQQSNSTYRGKAVNEACCACDGSKFRNIAPSSVPSEKPSISDSPSMEEYPSSVPSTEPSKCIDEPNWHFYNDTGHQLGCEDLIVDFGNEIDMCERFKDIYLDGKTVNTACCICGGGINLTRAPSSVPSTSQSPSLTPSKSSEPSFKPSNIPSQTPTISLAPSSFPIGINATILDEKECRADTECFSGECLFPPEQKITESFPKIGIDGVFDNSVSEENKTTTVEFTLREPVGSCMAGVLEIPDNMLDETSDFELLRNIQYYSENQEYFIVFTGSGYLELRDLQNASPLWSRPESVDGSRPNYVGNKCFLQENGNIIIYNAQGTVLWASVQNPLEACEGPCQDNSSCDSSKGLQCYDQSIGGPVERFLNVFDEESINHGYSRRLSEESSPPTPKPSDNPSSMPSEVPSETPSDFPSSFPSLSPSSEPSTSPSFSALPSQIPSTYPSLSVVPSMEPSLIPSTSPSNNPIPGCSGFNDGVTKFCYDPKREGQLQIGTILNLGEKYWKIRTLTLCEGSCENDGHCEEGLVCSSDPRGCNGEAEDGWGYCVYPELDPEKSSSNLSKGKSFLRIHNDGYIQVLTREDPPELVWSSHEIPNLENIKSFDRENDVSSHLSKELFSVGIYTREDFGMELNQTANFGLHVSTADSSVELHGTVSRAYELPVPILVSASSTISFDVTLGEGVSALALCVDDGLVPSNIENGRVVTSCLALGGSNIDTVFTKYILYGDSILPENSETSVEFDLDRLFPSRTKKIEYLGFVQVINENVADYQPSIIKNIIFSDWGQGRRRLQSNQNKCGNNADGTCPPGELAASSVPGLHDSCIADGDFCSPASTILRQITLNDGQKCIDHNECRSGFCNDDKECQSKDMTIGIKLHPKKVLQVIAENPTTAINVCEGDCDDNNDCLGTLKCFHDAGANNKEIPGCTRSEAFDISSTYSTWDFCYEVPDDVKLSWESTYGDANTFVDKGGSIVDSSGKIHLYGNVWTAFKLDQPYEVKGNTRVTFKFEMIQEAEGHAICFEDDTVPDTFGGFQKRCIVVGGTEFDHWDGNHVHKVVLEREDDSNRITASVDVKIAHFFSRRGTYINFIAFVQDNDASPYEGVSTFYDITLYEEEINTSWEHVPKEAPLKELDETQLDLFSSVLSYNQEYQASIVEKCHTSSRKDGLTQEMQNFSLDKNRLIRKMKCLEKSCQKLEYFTDLQLPYSSFKFLGNSRSSFKYITSYPTLVNSDRNTYKLRYDCPGGSFVSFMSRELVLSSTQIPYEEEYDCNIFGFNCEKRTRYFNVPVHVWVRKIECTDIHQDAGLVVDTSDTYPTETFRSTEHQSEDVECRENYYVAGVECEEKDSFTFHCGTMKLLCKKIEIVPKYKAITTLEFYTKSNDWGEPTFTKELRTLDRKVTNFKIPTSGYPMMCVSPQTFNSRSLPPRNQWVDDETSLGISGLGFSISNLQVFYYQNGEIVTHSIDSDGTLGDESKNEFNSERPYTSNSIPGITQPSGAYYGIFLERSVAISTPLTNHEGIRSSGAITFYRKTNSNDWTQDGVVYGVESNHKLGLYAVDFVNSHTLKVHSNHFGVDYFSNVLSECPKHSTMNNSRKCICDYGFLAVNKEQTLTRLASVGDYCTLAFFSSNVVQTLEGEKNFIQILIKNSDRVFSKSGINFEEYDWSQNIEMSQFSEDSNNPENIAHVYNENLKVIDSTAPSSDETIITLENLNPGKKYLAVIKNFVSNTLNHEIVSFPIIPSCSCQSITNEDQTGRPTHLEITQKKGHITFKFTDNSKCENGFSFTRFKGYAEFVDDSSAATTFTNDFIFQAPTQCNSTITPELEASDDLTLSRLPIGNIYSYCVRAVKEGNYMDISGKAEEMRSVSSSSSICQSHQIAWESSITGLVSTEPNAGTLPIEKVKVSWQVISSTGRPLSCGNCSGKTTTDQGGVFQIEINIQNESFLYGKEEDDIPVKLFFSKTTKSDNNEIQHRFLCNEGQDDCDNAEGHIMYLRHLHFDTPVHIYDDTSVPFTGKLEVYGTECPIVGAKACPLHKRISAENQDALTGSLCVETKSDGSFEAPIVIGSVIYGVRFEYEEHDFQKTLDNPWNYESGVQIAEGGFYSKNNFYDVTRTRLVVQVAGGACNLPLGRSTIELRIKGCHKDNQIDFMERTYNQSSYEQIYNNVPAQFLEVRVIDVEKQNEGGYSSIDVLKDYFYGTDPIVRTINLLSTEEEDEIENELIEEEDGGDTGKDTSEVKDKDDYKSTEEDKETVRFQYDGELEMEVDVKGDELDCTPTDSKFKEGNSFHVVEYMKIVNISVKLRFNLKNGNYCNIVDQEKHKLSIVSNLGMDRIGGFEKFYNGLSDKEKELLSVCSTIAPPSGSASGPCLLDIDSGESGSGKELALTVGRPNIDEPYTKSVNIRVIGAANNVQHRADFFIHGVFSLGDGDSFALPTHQPVMVLRDPPGGGSFASYNNVRSSVRIYNTHDKSSNDGKVAMKLGITLEPDTNICAGGGLGVILINCKEAVGGNTDNDGKSYQDIKAVNADSEKTITNSFSTTWSYTTSTDPSIAGEESDVFVVPNLNVFYEEVYTVKWESKENEACGPKLDGDKFPSTVIFDIEAPTNKPAFAFFSRHHITTTQIPAILNTLDVELDKVDKVTAAIKDGETKVCCDKQELKGFCLPTEGTLRKCTIEDLEQVVFDSGELFESLIHWQSILNSADVTKRQAIDDDNYGSILNWFEKQEQFQYIESVDPTKLSKKEKERVHMEKGIAGYSQLAPESLTDTMTALNDRKDIVIDPLVSNKEAKQANRIQFSGAGGEYSLTLDRSSSLDMTTMSCADSDIMKVMAIWQKVVKFDPVSYAKKAIEEETGAKLPLEKYGVQAFRGRIKKYLSRVENDDFKKELKEVVKEQDEKRVDRMEAIKKMEDEKIAKVEQVKKEQEAIQDKIDNETNLKKKKKLIQEKFEAQIKLNEAQKELEKEREQKKKENLVKTVTKEEEEKTKKAQLSNEEKEKLQERIDNEKDPKKKQELTMKKLEAELKPPKTPEEIVEQKKAMKEQRNEERSNKDLKDRTQSKIAEDTGKKSKWDKGSFLKNALKKLDFAFTAGPMVLASMQAGCNLETKYEASPADLDFSTSVFGIGVDAYFTGEFQAVITHESFVTDTEAEGTSVSFSLSDPDIDDEFVVDIYYDEYYGTFIFNTVAGRSKCVWEKGTGRSEDPSLISLNPASSFIYPDEKMVFEVEMKNAGRTSDSFFYVAQEATSRNLDVKLGGSGIVNENGIVIQLYKGKPVIKQIIISRGLLAKGVEGYEFPAIDLTLKSKCEADMNTRQNTKDGMYVTIPLFNDVNAAGQQVLKWIKPCPKIHWRGDLNRERNFLINKRSKEESSGLSILKIVIFNPLSSQKKKMTDLAVEDNLENVYLRFRKLGSTIWEVGESSATLDGDLHEMDFLDPKLGVEEDNYGFASLFWRLDNLEGIDLQGEYEIILETKCKADVNAPAEVKGFQEEAISGLFDLQPPEQYGEKALPLRQDIIHGEEMKVLFTENIRCDKPHSFKIEVDIVGFTKLDNENGNNIQVSCRDNQLGFQVANVDPTKIDGRAFHVTITDVEDEARNPISNPIKFSKSFANLDIEDASTTFKFTIHDSICSEESVGARSNEVKSKIAENIGLDTEDRVQIHELKCIDDSMIVADAIISPEVDDRKLRKKLQSKSHRLLLKDNISYTLVSAFARKEKIMSRSLLKSLSAPTEEYSVSMIELKPSEKDKIKFSSSEKQLLEEEEIISSSKEYIASQFTRLIDRTVHRTINSKEEKERDIKELKGEVHNLSNELHFIKDKEMEELRVRDEERMEEMKEEQRELKEMIRKLSEGGGKQEMTPMYMLQVGIIVVGCMVVGLALFQHNKR
ncbi:hypothetical protein CTEN210_09416 [Chaetoceros tenuissimus]|uniref:Bulb-type lectin domain-containing protein n=1 Tax=Chaetoceros tenuissimus TaxID=426638 RepID=A0AAD3H773_9STRA|nr:hypothetical protein CTEN210_09416 [Chaetoceros tenuissimus]